jgi:hypothetical protein
MKRKLMLKTTIAMLVLSLFGCAEILSFLPKVIASVAEAQIVLDRIEKFSTIVFAAAPNPALQRNVDQALDRCRTALAVALRTANGAKELGEKDAIAAFDDFKKAYQNLLVLVQPLGVAEGGPGAKLAATPGGLTVPPLMALSPQGG